MNPGIPKFLEVLVEVTGCFNKADGVALRLSECVRCDGGRKWLEKMVNVLKKHNIDPIVFAETFNKQGPHIAQFKFGGADSYEGIDCPDECFNLKDIISALAELLVS